MAYEIKELSGSIFKNKRKESDRHPDHQGSMKIGGVEYWVSGWNKTTQAGEPWISLAFKVKEQRQEPARPTAPPDGDPFADFKDDPLPF